MTTHSQPTRIHQFHYSASAGDAVSNQMFFIQSALSEIGISGEIYASRIKGLARNRVHPFKLDKIWDCDLLLIHHSHGNPDLRKISRIEIPKALIYHNITPAHFCRHDPYLAELCELGRKQLHSLLHEVIAAFADSKFNADELKRHHFPEAPILPLFDLTENLKETNSENTTTAKGEPKNILFVGRVTRHKNQALLIHTFFHLKKLLPKHSKLILVGSQDPIYGDYLKLLAKQLGLGTDVQFTGSVTQKSLDHYYEMADAFVCVSEHEGFCIPLVEAMSRHVPVFAIPNTGVKETLANSGVHLHTQRPHEIAQVLSTILESNSAIRTILKSQHQRLSEIREIQSKQRVQELLSALVQRVRTSSELHYGQVSAQKPGARPAASLF